MNPTKNRPFLTLASAALFATGTLGIASQTGAVDRIREFISEGKLSLVLRPRYEMVESTGDERANALTLGTRVGYTTREWLGVSAMFEVENVASPFPNAYNQSQLNPGGAAKAIVTDPTGTEVNQAWLRFDHGRFSVTAGRQRLNFDNGRFIGDVGWRQNMQTFDAALIEHRTTDDLSLAYAYIWRVNRVYGADHAQGVYDSRSHAIHASYSGFDAGTLTAYAYLLEFDGAALANSSATYGVSFDGRRSLGRWDLGYRAEYALQTDFGESPLVYSTNYLNAEVNAGYDRYAAGVGYEVLGTDNNFPFRTPLASLHNFNGWADVFLLTPAQGLRDFYVKGSARLPWWDIGLMARYHKFSTDTGLDLGGELDLQATYQINESLGATLKYADFRPYASMMSDVNKLWLQLELTY
jgi:hypothetical protein